MQGAEEEDNEEDIDEATNKHHHHLSENMHPRLYLLTFGQTASIKGLLD